MSTNTVLPASPNWYCSKVSAGNKAWIYVFGARHDVFCFDCQNFPPKFKGIFLGHREKVTALCLGDRGEEVTKCCSASEDGAVKLWDVETREVIQEHGLHNVSILCQFSGKFP